MNILRRLQFLSLLPIPLSTIFGNVEELISPKVEQTVLAEKEINLSNRYPEPSVNAVFKDNILLNLAYLRGDQIDPKNVDWDKLTKPFFFEFELAPDKTFSFHDDVLDKYQSSLVKNSGAHFNAQEGFKSSGYLFGDGVCHLASLIYWAAKEANLIAEAPTNHNFRDIPEIPKEYGVSIYSNPFEKGSNTNQNLYITNNKNNSVILKFDYDGQNIKVSITKLN